MGLDDQARQRIAVRFNARLPDRLEALAEEKCRMLRKATVHGGARSSYVTKSLWQLCVQELDVSIALAWQDMRRVVLSLRIPPSDTLAADLKKEVRVLLSVHYAEIKKLYQQWISIQHDRPRSLEPALENGYNKIDPEIDLFVDALMVQRDHPGSQGSIVIQGNAQVGAIVASPGASAQVTQQNISDNRQPILEALDCVLSAIAESSHGSELSEVQELISDAKLELEKPKPNSLKLSSSFGGIATAISMLADLRPAYECLKSTAAILGVSLP